MRLTEVVVRYTYLSTIVANLFTAPCNLSFVRCKTMEAQISSLVVGASTASKVEYFAE